MPYIPWLDSPEHAEASTEFDKPDVDDETAHDIYNAHKANYLDRAEREIVRLNDALTEPNALEAPTSKHYKFYLETLGEIVFDGTAEGALASPGIIRDAALARDLLTMEEQGLLAGEWAMDDWPAGREFVTMVLNRHGIIGRARDADHDATPAAKGLKCTTCDGGIHLDQPAGRFTHNVGAL